jgi:hypothetical protein
MQLLGLLKHPRRGSELPVSPVVSSPRREMPQAPSLPHNFAVWVLGRRPGFLKPQRYRYECLRCKWTFLVNDEHRGAVRAVADEGVPLSDSETAQRLATFAEGPCPGIRAVPAPSSRVVSIRKANYGPSASGANMWDLISISAIVLFFLIAAAYVAGCERL